MSYTPTQWATGDTVTAERLNKMESGIAAAAADPFIVTFTPTAQDLSGTMDKTSAEIQTAYDAGKSIVFRVILGEDYFVDIQLAFAAKFPEQQYRNYVAYLFNTAENLLAVAETGGTNNPDNYTYNTTIYPLTPMS